MKRPLLKPFNLLGTVQEWWENGTWSVFDVNLTLTIAIMLLYKHSVLYILQGVGKDNKYLPTNHGFDYYKVQSDLKMM